MDENAAVALPDADSIPDGVSAECTYAILADRDRRRLLHWLGQLDTPERLSALTRTLAMARDASEPTDTNWIRTRLHHVHVPKLESAGFVTYDREERTVELTTSGETLAATLEE